MINSRSAHRDSRRERKHRRRSYVQKYHGPPVEIHDPQLGALFNMPYRRKSRRRRRSNRQSVDLEMGLPRKQIESRAEGAGLLAKIGIAVVLLAGLLVIGVVVYKSPSGASRNTTSVVARSATPSPEETSAVDSDSEPEETASEEPEVEVAEVKDQSLLTQLRDKLMKYKKYWYVPVAAIGGIFGIHKLYNMICPKKQESFMEKVKRKTVGNLTYGVKAGLTTYAAWKLLNSNMVQDCLKDSGEQETRTENESVAAEEREIDQVSIEAPESPERFTVVMKKSGSINPLNWRKGARDTYEIEPCLDVDGKIDYFRLRHNGIGISKYEEFTIQEVSEVKIDNDGDKCRRVKLIVSKKKNSMGNLCWTNNRWLYLNEGEWKQFLEFCLDKDGIQNELPRNFRENAGLNRP